MSLLNHFPGETKVEKLVAMVIASGMLAAVAQSTQKPVRTSIYLEKPIETPNGVQFSWSGGEQTLHYSLYRRKVGEVVWERIELNLPHQGVFFAPGFTLSEDYEYQMKSDY